MITGDASINAGAPIICCTAEILANQALREGEKCDVGCVAMDEFHFYADPDRGWAWQVPLLTLPHTQFLLMSATLGDTSSIAEALSEHTGGRTVDTIADAPRPVPLSYEFVDTALEGTVELALRAGEAPLYIVHFSQDAALASAQSLASYGVSTKEQREAVKEAIKGTRFTTTSQDAAAPAGMRRGRAPRRHAAALSPARGEARAAGPSAGHLRHGHARRGYQRADSHRGAHRALQV